MITTDVFERDSLGHRVLQVPFEVPALLLRNDAGMLSCAALPRLVEDYL